MLSKVWKITRAATGIGAVVPIASCCSFVAKEKHKEFILTSTNGHKNWGGQTLAGENQPTEKIVIPEERGLSQSYPNTLSKEESPPTTSNLKEGEEKSLSSFLAPKPQSNLTRYLDNPVDYSEFTKYYGITLGEELLNRKGRLDNLVSSEVYKKYGLDYGFWSKERYFRNQSTNLKDSSHPIKYSQDHHLSLKFNSGVDKKGEQLKSPTILDAWELLWRDFDLTSNTSQFLGDERMPFIFFSLPEYYLNQPSQVDKDWIRVKYEEKEWNFVEDNDSKKYGNLLPGLKAFGKYMNPEKTDKAFFITQKPKTLLLKWLTEWDSEKRKNNEDKKYYLYDTSTIKTDNLKAIQTLKRKDKGKFYELYIPYSLTIVSNSRYLYVNQYFSLYWTYYFGQESFMWHIFKYYVSLYYGVHNIREYFAPQKWGGNNREKTYSDLQLNTGGFWWSLFAISWNQIYLYTTHEEGGIYLYFLPLLLDEWYSTSSNFEKASNKLNSIS